VAERFFLFYKAFRLVKKESSDRVVKLSILESKILSQLISSCGPVTCWDLVYSFREEGSEIINPNVLARYNIKKLRSKLSIVDPSLGAMLVTIRGKGYLWGVGAK
jgi:DNA-binding response OmpR family regulator